MKTFIVNKTAEIVEKVKRTIFTVQVIALGFFISFLFAFGISYNNPGAKSGNDTKITAPVPTATVSNGTVILENHLSDQNG